MMRRMTTLATALLVAVLLAACGDGGGTTAAGSGDETPVTGSQGDATGGDRVGRGAVEGVVQRASGAVVPGVMVVPVPLDEPAPAIPELAVLTDPRGTYRWDLPVGRYEVQALHEGALLGSTEVEVAPGGTAAGDITVP